MEIVGSVARTRFDRTYRNSDLAFWGRLAYAGHYDGFQIIDAANPRKPKQLVDFDCPGSQHDVSVWQNLLFVSVESPRSSAACESTPQAPGFEGMRIFDVSNPRSPSLIKGVPTDCGSHTHTLVPDPENGRVLLYVQSYAASPLPPSEYGNECARFDAMGQRAHNKISVVEVPLDDPGEASVVSEPRFPQNDRNGIPGYLGCHDVTVFMEIRRAAAACMDEGQIWDLSDLENPRTIARVHNPNVEFFHSATFSYDGERVIFGDEAGGGTGPRCREQDPMTLGALWFYDVASLDNMDDTSVEQWRSSWKVPRIQGDEPNCTTHNFNTLPNKKRDVLVSSAYAAGTTVVDFTDASNPTEVGHLDPHGANQWSAYWYNGHIFTNDGGRGVDILKIKDKATNGTKRFPYSNPQTQVGLVD
ncbi:MAG: LVIVD repeat-containing protein [Solirubrobacteraceae bacterium]